MPSADLRLRLAFLMLVCSVGVGCATAEEAEETVRPGFCDPTDTALNDGHGPEVDQFYSEEKGPLSEEDCRELAGLLDEAEAFASQFPTVADVEQAGWKQYAVFTPGQGVHYIAPGDLEGPFNPERPRYLLYDGSEASSRLAGMMFLEERDAPPAGFPGDNDHWHNHAQLCFAVDRNFVLAEHVTAERCEKIGGELVDSRRRWMVHVWLPVYDGWEPDRPAVPAAS